MLCVSRLLLLVCLVELLVEEDKIEKLCDNQRSDATQAREGTLEVDEARVVLVEHLLEGMEQRGRVLEESEAGEAILQTRG